MSTPLRQPAEDESLPFVGDVLRAVAVLEWLAAAGAVVGGFLNDPGYQGSNAAFFWAAFALLGAGLFTWAAGAALHLLRDGAAASRETAELIRAWMYPDPPAGDGHHTGDAR